MPSCHGSVACGGFKKVFKTEQSYKELKSAFELAATKGMAYVTVNKSERFAIGGGGQTTNGSPASQQQEVRIRGATQDQRWHR
jgi:hypothetical protein